MWSLALASCDADDPHIELAACFHAHPHTDWFDFRITTTVGAAIKVDQESLPSFQEAGDLAIARLVGVTVSRDVDAVDAFWKSAASIQVIPPGNRTPVAMEGSGMLSAASAGDAAAATTSARKRRFIVISSPSAVRRRGCAFLGRVHFCT